MNTYLMIISIVICMPMICSGAVIHVPGDHLTIQAGIDAAVNGDTVLVADGTYTGDGNRDLDFLGKPITVMSESGPELCILDVQGTASEHHRGFYLHSGESDNSVINGFTIMNGHGSSGGGIWLGQASANILNCHILECRAEWGGGGIGCSDCDICLENCVIRGNYSELIGGGVDVVHNSNMEILNCVISDNYSERDGGGIQCHSNINIFNSIISDNYSRSLGGGINFGNLSSGLMNNCIIQNNTSKYSGGGIYFVDNSEVIIGGDESGGNYFDNNNAGLGSDLFAGGNRTIPINAQYNTFSGYHLSNYYVTSHHLFDLSYCISELNPTTQDVFVSLAGNDSNDGLSWDTAFLTIRKALRSIYGSETDPVIVHIGPGIYSPSTNNEWFPLPLMNYIEIKAENLSNTSLIADWAIVVFTGYESIASKLSNIKITRQPVHRGSGIELFNASLSLNNCIISDHSVHQSYLFGYGLKCYNSTGDFTNTRIMRNFIGISLERSDFNLSNCVISENTYRGIFCEYSSPTLFSSTLSENSGIALESKTSDPEINNCIFWNESIPEITASSWNPTQPVVPIVKYSDIRGGYTGEGNINSDPKFVPGSEGNYYLSQVSAGQQEDSPCLDSGNPDLNLFGTTRTDHYSDTGIIDMGYHTIVFHTPTPSPTVTITPTPTPADWTGVKLIISGDEFTSGDIFKLRAQCMGNPGDTIADLYVILDVSGNYWFHPDWTVTPDYESLNLNENHPVVSFILDFIWPEGVEGSAEGLLFWGAIFEPETGVFIGDYDVEEFGYN